MSQNANVKRDPTRTPARYIGPVRPDAWPVIPCPIPSGFHGRTRDERDRERALYLGEKHRPADPVSWAREYLAAGPIGRRSMLLDL